ncbi:MAG: hypothetical protein JXR70_12420 [Spirochaetales bacterium]|nr:hypothetical protein [Spirochaetales bacterium]
MKVKTEKKELVFRCEKCLAKLKAKISSINKRGKCPECKTIITIKDNWEEY